MLKSLRSVLAVSFCCCGSLGLSNNSDLWVSDLQNILVKCIYPVTPLILLSSLYPFISCVLLTHPPSRGLWQWGQSQWTARRWEMHPTHWNALHMALALDDAFLCGVNRLKYHLVSLWVLWYTTELMRLAHPKTPAIGHILTAHCSAAGFEQLPLWVLVSVVFSVCSLLRWRLFCTYSLWCLLLKGTVYPKMKSSHCSFEPVCLSSVEHKRRNIEEYACCFFFLKYSKVMWYLCVRNTYTFKGLVHF